MITIDELCVGDTADAWRAIGFDVDDDVCSVGSVRLRFGSSGAGITGWTLRGIPAATTDADGIPTNKSTTPASDPARHANGVTRIDHVVLMTPDLPRTTTALAALGLEVRRERDAGAFSQLFLRLGEEILEVVGPKEAGPGPANLWGLTFVVDDIDATAEFLGDRIGRVKDAVQPGRRITTLRGQAIGITPAVAFITERAR
jgi:catechol 2,3-dioxygenase-like lactoylglutathione lyase family enzyme